MYFEPRPKTWFTWSPNFNSHLFTWNANYRQVLKLFVLKFSIAFVWKIVTTTVPASVLVTRYCSGWQIVGSSILRLHLYLDSTWLFFPTKANWQTWFLFLAHRNLMYRFILELRKAQRCPDSTNRKHHNILEKHQHPNQKKPTKWPSTIHSAKVHYVIFAQLSLITDEYLNG